MCIRDRLMGEVLSPDEIIAAYDAVTREDVRTLARELFLSLIHI